ncbi:MAG: undecaprenyldiphospho-muramoylpentapeptide beta-N-acetylglucosaminyltransferase, partial [Bdellovibrionota bacterium]
MTDAHTAKPLLMVAGGGTGGHVLAGIAVADAWRAKYGADCPVVFVGASGKIEEKLVPRAGYPLHLLKLGSLNRVSIAQKLKTYFQLPLSLLKSLALLLQFRPSAVLGVGGYASGPLVLLARFFTRTAILEQNSVPGFTNRILGRWAHQVFSAFPGAERIFGAGRVRITGNPIRTTMKPLPSAPRDPFTIFIFGGSQGAIPMNSLVLEALPLLSDLKSRLRFIHQTGEKDYERVAAGHLAAGYTSRVEKFIYDMPECYAQASLLICRSGSGTMSELAAVGRAAILVPFPFASDNHQEANARVFSDAGAAWLLRQQEAKGEDLAR